MQKLVTSEVKKVYLALDKDAIKSTFKIAEQLLKAGKKLFVVDLTLVIGTSLVILKELLDPFICLYINNLIETTSFRLYALLGEILPIFMVLKSKENS